MDGGHVAFDTGLQTLAASLAADFATRAAAHDRDGSVPRENFAALHQAGLLGLTVPQAFGGRGGGLRDCVAVIGTIAQGDPATALILSMQYLQHAGQSRDSRWPASVHRHVAEAAMRDGALINALRVEPELGSPHRGGLPATTARRVEGGWILSGRKMFSTGAELLRWGLVWARTDADVPDVGMFLVPMAAAGVTIVESWDHLGMRATGSHDVVFQDVALPADHALDLRAPEAWKERDPTALAWNNVTIAALYDGVARAARAWLIGYLHERVPSNLGASLATLPRFQETVGEIEALLAVNRRLIDHAAEQVDLTPDQTPDDPTLVKYTVTGNAIRAVELGLAAIGNAGLSRHNPLERHYRDVLCSRIHAPQNDMILIAAGRKALGV
jgi:alkylation response protein AidB-like acyl-CoA dehydrogenase